MFPSTSVSSTPVTVTVCGVVPFVAVKVRLAGETVPSVVSLLLSGIVTLAAREAVQRHCKRGRTARLSSHQPTCRGHRNTGRDCIVVVVGHAYVGGIHSIVVGIRTGGRRPSRSCRRCFHRPAYRPPPLPSPSAASFRL